MELNNSSGTNVYMRHWFAKPAWEYSILGNPNLGSSPTEVAVTVLSRIYKQYYRNRTQLFGQEKTLFNSRLPLGYPEAPRILILLTYLI